jgi:hypothetical protein
VQVYCLTYSKLGHSAAQLLGSGEKVHYFGLLLLVILTLHFVLEPLVTLEAKENQQKTFATTMTNTQQARYPVLPS